MAGILETVGKNFTNNLIKGVNTAIKVKADGLGAISEFFNENKFDRYDDTTKVITNSTYKVTPMDKSTLDTIAQDTDNTELWLLEDSSKKDYDTAYGTRNIGKRVLDGVDEEDRFVVYNKTTKQIYKYKKEDEETSKIRKTYESAKTALEIQERQLKTSMALYETKIEGIQKQLDSAKTYAERSRLFNEYSNTLKSYEDMYGRSVRSIQDTQSIYEQLKTKYDSTGTIDPNSGYASAMERWYNDAQLNKEKYAEINGKIADSTDNNKISSVSDVLFRTAAKYLVDISAELYPLSESAIDEDFQIDRSKWTFSDEELTVLKERYKDQSFTEDFNKLADINIFANTVRDVIRAGKDAFNGDFNKAIENFYKEYPLSDVVQSGDVQMSKAVLINTINALVGFGEDMDKLGAGAVKAMLNSPGVSSEEAIKATMGLSTEYDGIVNFDWDTGNVFMDLVGEVLSDPSTYLTLGTSALTKSSVKKLLSKEDLFKVIKESGIEITSKDIEQLTKKAANTALRTDVPLDLAITRTLNDFVVKRKFLVDLSDVAGLDYAALKRNIDKLVESNGSFNLNAVSDVLKKTNMTDKAITETLRKIGREKDVALKGVSQFVSTLSDTAAYKVAGTMIAVKNTDEEIGKLMRRVSTLGIPYVTAGTVKLIRSVAQSADFGKLTRYAHRLADAANEKDVAKVVNAVEETKDSLHSSFVNPNSVEYAQIKNLSDDIQREFYNAMVLDILEANRQGVVEQYTNGVYSLISEYAEDIKRLGVLDMLSPAVASSLMSASKISYKKVVTDKIARLAQDAENIKVFKDAFDLFVKNQDSYVEKTFVNVGEDSIEKAIAVKSIVDFTEQLNNLNLERNLFEYTLVKDFYKAVDAFNEFAKVRVADVDIYNKIISDLQGVTNKLLEQAENFSKRVSVVDKPYTSSDSLLEEFSTKASKQPSIHAVVQNIVRKYAKEGVDVDKITSQVFVQDLMDYFTTNTLDKDIYMPIIAKSGQRTMFLENKAIDKLANKVLGGDAVLKEALISTAAKDDNAAKIILEVFTGYRLEKDLHKLVDESVEKEVAEALYDTLADSTKMFNSAIRKISYADDRATYESIKANLVENIVNGMIEYTNKSKNSFYDYTGMFRHKENKTVNYNSPKTFEAVTELYQDVNNAEDKMFESAREYLNKDRELYKDVFISTTKAGLGAEHVSISFIDESGALAGFQIKGTSFFGTEKDARKLHGTSVEGVRNALKEKLPEGVLEVKDELEFYTNVKEYFNTQSRIASNTGRRLRVVMYNSGTDTTGSGRALTDYMKRRLMETYIDEFVDVARFVRRDKGYINFEESSVEAVRNVVDQTIHNSELYKNLYGVFSTPMFSADKLVTASKMITTQKSLLRNVPGIEELSDTVSNYKMLETDFAKSVGKDSLLNITLLEQLIDDVNGMPFGATKLNIVKEINELSESVLNRPSFMNVYNKWSYDMVETWFKGIEIVPEERFRFESVMRKAKALNLKLGALKHTGIAYMFTTSDMEDLLESLKAFKKYGDATARDIDVYKIEEGPMRFIAMLDKINNEINFEEIAAESAKYNTAKREGKKYVGAFTEDVENIVSYFEEVEEFAFGKYTLASKPNSKTAASLALDSVLDSTENMLADAKNFYTKLEQISIERTYQRDPAAINQVHVINKENIMQSVKRFVANLDAMKSSAVSQIPGLKDIEDLRSLKNSAKRLSDIANTIRKERINLDTTRAIHILGLRGKDLEAFVVRSNFNAFIIQPGASFIKESPEAVKNLLDMLSSMDRDIFSVKFREDGSILIQSKRALELLESGTEYGKYLKDLDIVDEGRVYKDVYMGKPFLADTLDSLSDKMPTRFFESGYNVFTHDSYDLISKEVKGMVDKRLAEKMGWFSDSFNTQVLGDYEYIKKYFPYSSENVVNNLFNGMNLLSDNFKYIQDIGNIVQSKHVRFSNFVYNLEDITKDNADVLQKSIDNASWSLAKFTYKNIGGESVVSGMEKLTVNKKNFDELLGDPGVMLLDSSMYTTVGALLKTQNAKQAMQTVRDTIKRGGPLALAVNFTNVLANFYKEMQQVRVYMWLFKGVGTWINNGIDSNYKALLSARSLDYVAERKRYIELLNRFEDVRGHVIVNENNVDLNRISKWYRSDNAKELYGDIESYLPFEEFTKIYAINTHQSGSIVQDVIDATKANQLKKLAKQMGFETEDDIATYAKSLERHEPFFNKAWAKYTDVTGAVDYAALQRELFDYIDSHSITSKAKLKDVIMNYTPNIKTFADKIESMPIVGKYFGMNRDMFGRIEQHTRTSLAMFFMDYFGDTPAQAIERMLETQFDYSNRTKAGDILNLTIPFSTFKIMNTKYWLKAYMNDMFISRLTDDTVKTMIIPDSWELAKSLYWQKMYSELGVEDNSEEEQGGFLENSIGDAIQGYENNPIYAQLRGNIIIKDINIKYNYTFMDALSLFGDIAQTFVTGDVKSFLSEQLYSPLVTLYGLSEMFLSDGDIGEYVSDNFYDVVDFIPLVGSLINGLFAKMRQGNLSKADLSFAFALGNGEVWEMIGAALTVGVTTMFGTVKEQKPVGYDWSNQTDEYKATHNFVYGVSSVPTFLTRDPAVFIDHVGLLLKMGYSKDEALDLLQKGWYFTEDGNIVQYNLYSDEEMPNLFKYNQEVFDNTLMYLLERGYNIEDAYTLMQHGGYWVDEEGNKRNDTDLKGLLEESIFSRTYFMLPDYIKNIDGQYAKQIEYYKEQGYSTEEARRFMMTDGLFIDPDGDVYELTDAAVEEYNKQYKTSYEKARKEKAAKSGVSYGRSKKETGIKRVYQDSFKPSLKSSYPATYRNIVWGDTRSLYKEQYMSNGAPIRLMMRSTRYYNNSTMRFKMRWRRGRFERIRSDSRSTFNRIIRGY